MKKTSSIILRVGIALVIIWFGYQQLSDPTSWLAYLPTWATQLPISQLAIIYINGWFEVIFGLMLFFGFYTRFVALLLALHMLDITYTVGYGAIGVRDFGLAVGMVAIFFHGMSPFSVDMFFASDDIQPPLPTPPKSNLYASLQPTIPKTPYDSTQKTIPLKRTF